MKIIRIIAAAALACMSVGANAAPFLFDVKGAYDVRFQLDSDSVPNVVDDNRFEVNDVGAMLPGGAATFDVMAFFTDISGGGFNIWNNRGGVVFEAEGPVLFTGGTDRPTFLTGTFDLFAIGADRSAPPAYTLTVSAIPEPAVWLTMIVGLWMVGVVIRRRPVPRPAIA